jgi:hypothetical protein
VCVRACGTCSFRAAAAAAPAAVHLLPGVALHSRQAGPGPLERSARAATAGAGPRTDTGTAAGRRPTISHCRCGPAQIWPARSVGDGTLGRGAVVAGYRVTVACDVGACMCAQSARDGLGSAARSSSSADRPLPPRLTYNAPGGRAPKLKTWATTRPPGRGLPERCRDLHGQRPWVR